MTETRTVDGAGLGTMLRAVLPSVPLVNRVPGLHRSGGDLPDLVLQREATVERDHVAAYAGVCGFPEKDAVPVPYLHLLAFPLHLAVMTDTRFPHPTLGTIHVENGISHHRPVLVGERVSLSARAARQRAHAKGTLFDLDVEVTADGEMVWESTSTYLRPGRSDAEQSDPGRSFTVVPAGGIPWRLPADLGRRYAAVSGDRNPIHLYAVTAKAFGFRRPIAHGMWTLARCLAAVENRLPAAMRVEAAWKKPVHLPGTVGFGVQTSGEALEFTMSDPATGAPHVLGRATRL